MQVFIFDEFGLKVFIHAPNRVFSGILPPKYGTITSRPQKAPRCTEECHTKYRLLRYRSTRFCIAHPFTQSPEILCFAIPKSASSRWAICTPSNIWFLMSTRFSIPNGIWISSAIFAKLTAERPYTVGL